LQSSALIYYTAKAKMALDIGKENICDS